MVPLLLGDIVYSLTQFDNFNELLVYITITKYFQNSNQLAL